MLKCVELANSRNPREYLTSCILLREENVRVLLSIDPFSHTTQYRFMGVSWYLFNLGGDISESQFSVVYI